METIADDVGAMLEKSGEHFESGGTWKSVDEFEKFRIFLKPDGAKQSSDVEAAGDISEGTDTVAEFVQVALIHTAIRVELFT